MLSDPKEKPISFTDFKNLEMDDKLDYIFLKMVPTSRIRILERKFIALIFLMIGLGLINLGSYF